MRWGKEKSVSLFSGIPAFQQYNTNKPFPQICFCCILLCEKVLKKCRCLWYTKTDIMTIGIPLRCLFPLFGT